MRRTPALAEPHAHLRHPLRHQDRTGAVQQNPAGRQTRSAPTIHAEPQPPHGHRTNVQRRTRATHRAHAQHRPQDQPPTADRPQPPPTDEPPTLADSQPCDGLSVSAGHQYLIAPRRPAPASPRPEYRTRVRHRTPSGRPIPDEPSAPARCRLPVRHRGRAQRRTLARRRSVKPQASHPLRRPARRPPSSDPRIPSAPRARPGRQPHGAHRTVVGHQNPARHRTPIAPRHPALGSRRPGHRIRARYRTLVERRTAGPQADHPPQRPARPQILADPPTHGEPRNPKPRTQLRARALTELPIRSALRPCAAPTLGARRNPTEPRTRVQPQNWSGR